MAKLNCHKAFQIELSTSLDRGKRFHICPTKHVCVSRCQPPITELPQHREDRVRVARCRIGLYIKTLEGVLAARSVEIRLLPSADNPPFLMPRAALSPSESTLSKIASESLYSDCPVTRQKARVKPNRR